MEIEHLSKSQIVLLTLFTSFVSAIASGIVTFSLVQQAPPVVTQTVNRIVERTVEKAVPGARPALVAAPVTKTVVVKQSDALAAAVAAAAPSVVKLYTRDPESSRFLCLGAVITASGVIVTDAAALGDLGDVAVEAGGVRVRAFVTRRDPSSGIAFLSATTSSEKPPAWKPFDIATAHPALGQSVVALEGKAAMRIGPGVVTRVFPASAEAPELADTNISEDIILAGSPLIDENGALVGLSTSVSRGQAPGAFVSAQALVSQEKGKEPEARQ